MKCRIALFMVTALVVAGCGVRWDDEQRAAAMASARSSSEAGTSDVVGGEGDTGRSVSDPEDTGPGAVESATTAPSGRSGGDGAAGADSANGDAGAASGPLPCAGPSDAPGVTDDTITIGSVHTIQGPVPGLFRTAKSSIQAYVAHLNAQGGVCGRQVELLLFDDAGDNGQNRAAISEISSKTLAAVGAFSIADAGGSDVVRKEALPYVGQLASAEILDLPTTFTARPPVLDSGGGSPKYRHLFEEGARKVALVYTANASARRQVSGLERPLMEAAGMKIVLTEEVPVSTLSFDSTANKVASSGADYMLFLSDASFSASMVRAIDDSGYDLRFEEYITGYGSNFLDLAGSAAEGARNWIVTLPDEEVGPVPEQVTYLEWFRRTAPSEKPDVYSAITWAAAKAFFDSLQALDGSISRDAVLAEMRSLHEFDADGLLGRIDFGRQQAPGCEIELRVVDGAWRRSTPTQGFLC